MYTARQQSILESIASGEVGYTTFLGGFYFNRPLQLQLADEDQAFLKSLLASGQIRHKRIGAFEYCVCFTEANTGSHGSEDVTGLHGEWHVTADGNKVHIYGRNITEAEIEQVRQIIAEIERREAEPAQDDDEPDDQTHAS